MTTSQLPHTPSVSRKSDNTLTAYYIAKYGTQMKDLHSSPLKEQYDFEKMTIVDPKSYRGTQPHMEVRYADGT